MSHQYHQRMSLRVANNNVSASVPVETTNTTNNATNTENNEENTNQMTCVMREFFFCSFCARLEPLSLVFRFALKNFFRESLIYMRDDDDEVQHTHNNKKVS